MDDDGGSELIHARLTVSREAIWRFSLLLLVVFSQCRVRRGFVLRVGALLALTIFCREGSRFPAAAAAEVAVRLLAVPVRAVRVVRGHKLVASAAPFPMSPASRAVRRGIGAIAFFPSFLRIRALLSLWPAEVRARPLPE